MFGKKSKIFIAGHNGLVGSSVYNNFKKNYSNVFTINKNKLDLTNEKKVMAYFKKNKFDLVIICAAKVGGIYANYTYPTEFILDNLKIQNNLIMASFYNKVKRLIFLGSSCIYPKKTKNPIHETQLLDGKLEETNESYAIAKIAGIKLCEALYRQYDFDTVSIMPTNVYGINDNFDPKNSHVIPGIISKTLRAIKLKKKTLRLLGTGDPLREFIFSEDLAEAIKKIATIPKKKLFNICNNSYPIINVGSGFEIKIRDLAKKISKICNFKGKILFGAKNNRMDGTFRKKLNLSRLKKINWKPKVNLDDGLKKVIYSLKLYD